MMDGDGGLPTRGGDEPLWRRVENAIRQEILAGVHPPGAQLPSDRQIAASHGASRETARRALASLEQDGLLRIEHGNGTFVSDDALVRYRLNGSRVRFSQDAIAIDGAARLSRRLLSTREVPAAGEIATRLGLAVGETVLELEIAAYADDRPISVGIRHCSAARFRGLDAAFEREQSITKALTQFGVADYRRASTELMARLPTPHEAKVLAQPRVQPVLAYAATDVETATGLVISYQLVAFAGNRVVMSIGET